VYVTDTHGLAWRLLEVSDAVGKRRLRGFSPRARRIFSAADEGRETILIPSIVIVEMVYMNERGIIPRALLDRILADLSGGPENYRVVPLDLEVIRHSWDISPAVVHEMPDRIIAAPAKALGAKLLSKEEALGKAAGVQVVW